MEPVYLQELKAKRAEVSAKNLNVWNVKKDKHIRINVVEFSGELGLHKHPDADHSIMILEGQVEALVDKKSYLLKPGDFLSVPKDVPHKYWSLTAKSRFLSMDAPYYDPAKTVKLE